MGQKAKYACIRNEIEMLQIKHELMKSQNTDEVGNLSLLTDFIISGLTARVMSLMIPIDSEHIIILGGNDKFGNQMDGVLINTEKQLKITTVNAAVNFTSRNNQYFFTD